MGTRWRTQARATPAAPGAAGSPGAVCSPARARLAAAAASALGAEPAVAAARVLALDLDQAPEVTLTDTHSTSPKRADRWQAPGTKVLKICPAADRRGVFGRGEKSRATQVASAATLVPTAEERARLAGLSAEALASLSGGEVRRTAGFASFMKLSERGRDTIFGRVRKDGS